MKVQTGDWLVVSDKKSFLEVSCEHPHFPPFLHNTELFCFGPVTLLPCEARLRAGVPYVPTGWTPVTHFLGESSDQDYHKGREDVARMRCGLNSEQETTCWRTEGPLGLDDW